MSFLPSSETSLHQAAALRQRTICHYIVEAGASLMKTDLQVSADGLTVGTGMNEGLLGCWRRVGTGSHKVLADGVNRRE